MENETMKAGTLLIAKDHVKPLTERFSLVRNELAELFDLPPASPAAAQSALTWWEAQPAAQQYTYRAALAALASPALIADVGINSRNEMLISTHAIIPSLRWNDPCFLFAAEDGGAQFRLEYLQQSDIFANTLLLYLQGGAPLYGMEMKFELPVRDFAVLLGMIDLHQRKTFRALLDHAPVLSSYTKDDVAAAVADGIGVADPRWLLAFCLPALHVRADAFSKDSVFLSVANLAKAGLITLAGNTTGFTPAGKQFADSVSNRLSSIRLDTYGVDAAGHRGRQSVLFIRGEGLLWYAGISGTKADTVVVAAISIDQAEALIRELFTPMGVPKPVVPSQPATPVQAAAAPPAPPKQPAGAAKHFCQDCGKPLEPGKKFCSNCGSKIG